MGKADYTRESGKGEKHHCFHAVDPPLPMPQFPESFRLQNFFFSPAPGKKTWSVAGEKRQ